MRFRSGRSWYCDGCRKTHSINARDVEGISPDGGEWCGASIRRAIKEGRNVPLPGIVLDSQRRTMSGTARCPARVHSKIIRQRSP